jgi:hypothetical protein
MLQIKISFKGPGNIHHLKKVIGLMDTGLSQNAVDKVIITSQRSRVAG